MYETIIPVLFVVVTSWPALSRSHVVTKSDICHEIFALHLWIIANYASINITPRGGEGGGGLAPEIRRFRKSGSLEFPTHESHVCQKSPRGALKQNRTLFYIISQATRNVFKNLKLSCLRSHHCVKVFWQIPGGSDFCWSNPRVSPPHPFWEKTLIGALWLYVFVCTVASL